MRLRSGCTTHLRLGHELTPGATSARHGGSAVTLRQLRRPRETARPPRGPGCPRRSQRRRRRWSSPSPRRAPQPATRRWRRAAPSRSCRSAENWSQRGSMKHDWIAGTDTPSSGFVERPNDGGKSMSCNVFPAIRPAQPTQSSRPRESPIGASSKPLTDISKSSKPGSMHERPWRIVQHDLRGAVRRVPFYEHARQNALRPGAVHDPFNFRLTRGEASGAILRVQDESAEVAKTVVDKTHHFAGECQALL